MQLGIFRKIRSKIVFSQLFSRSYKQKKLVLLTLIQYILSLIQFKKFTTCDRGCRQPTQPSSTVIRSEYVFIFYRLCRHIFPCEKSRERENRQSPSPHKTAFCIEHEHIKLLFFDASLYHLYERVQKQFFSARCKFFLSERGMGQRG